MPQGGVYPGPGRATSSQAYGMRMTSNQIWDYCYPGEKFKSKYIPQFSSLKTDSPYIGDSLRTISDFGGGAFDPCASCGMYLAEEFANAKLYYGILYMAHVTSGNAWYPDGSASGKTLTGYRGMNRPNNFGQAPANFIEPIPYFSY